MLPKADTVVVERSLPTLVLPVTDNVSSNVTAPTTLNIPLVIVFTARTLPLVLKLANVPTLVMFGCAAVVNEPVILVTANVLVTLLNVNADYAPIMPSSLN